MARPVSFLARLLLVLALATAGLHGRAAQANELRPAEHPTQYAALTKHWIAATGSSGSFGPSWQADFTTASLPSGVTVSSPSLGGLVTDSTGRLTYKPNNLLTWSNDFTNAAWTKSSVNVTTGIADPFGGTNATTITSTAAGGYVRQRVIGMTGNALNTIWIRRRSGTGNIDIQAPGAGSFLVTPITTAWTQITKTDSNVVGAWVWVQLEVSGDAVDIYAPTLSTVTYETTPRAADQVITGASAYYGPAWDYAPNDGVSGTYAANNLLVQSNTFSNAAWIKQTGVTATDNAVAAPDGTQTAAQISWSSTAAGQGIYQASLNLSGVNNVKSIWARADVAGGTIGLTDPGSSVGETIATLTTSWQQIKLSEAASGAGYGGVYIRKKADSPSTIYITRAVDSVVATETSPRPQDQVITTSSAYYGAGNTALTWIGNPLGLRIWEQRQNLVKSSGAIGDGNWTTFGSASVALNSAVSPDGTSNASTLTFTASQGDFYYQSYAGASNPYTFSVWAKSSTSKKFSIHIYDGSADHISADFTTTSTWQRFTFTYTGVVANVQVRNDSTGTAGSLNVWGAQLELGSTASPYIPTGASAVTAAADVVTLGGVPLAVMQGAQGTVIAETGSIANVPNTPIILGDAAANTNAFLYVRSDNRAGALVNGTLLSSTNTATWSGTNRIGASFGSGGVSLALNGTTPSTLAGAFSASSGYRLGNYNGGSQYIDGYIRKLALYSTKLPDFALQQRTVANASFAVNDNIPDWLRHSFAANDNLRFNIALGD